MGKITELIKGFLDFLSGYIIRDWIFKRNKIKSYDEMFKELEEEKERQFRIERDSEEELQKIDSDMPSDDLERLLSGDKPNKKDSSSSARFRKG